MQNRLMIPHFFCLNNYMKVAYQSKDANWQCQSGNLLRSMMEFAVI